MVSIVQYYGVTLDFNFLRQIFVEDFQEAEDEFAGDPAEIDLEFFDRLNILEHLTKPSKNIKIEKLYMNMSIVIGYQGDVKWIESGNNDIIQFWKPKYSDIGNLHNYIAENDLLRDKEPGSFIYCDTNS